MVGGNFMWSKCSYFFSPLFFLPPSLFLPLSPPSLSLSPPLSLPLSPLPLSPSFSLPLSLSLPSPLPLSPPSPSLSPLSLSPSPSLPPSLSPSLPLEGTSQLFPDEELLSVGGVSMFGHGSQAGIVEPSMTYLIR